MHTIEQKCAHFCSIKGHYGILNPDNRWSTQETCLQDNSTAVHKYSYAFDITAILMQIKLYSLAIAGPFYPTNKWNRRCTNMDNVSYPQQMRSYHLDILCVVGSYLYPWDILFRINIGDSMNNIMVDVTSSSHKGRIIKTHWVSREYSIHWLQQ